MSNGIDPPELDDLMTELTQEEIREMEEVDRALELDQVEARRRAWGLVSTNPASI